MEIIKLKSTSAIALLLAFGLVASSNLLADGTTGSTHSLRRAVLEVPRRFDEYGDLIQDDEGARLDAFEKELKKEGDSKGYIIVYGGGQDPPGKARRYAHRAKLYLVEARGIKGARIVPIDGGHRENLTVELWIVPSDDHPLLPTPTLSARRSDDRKTLKYDEYSYGYEFSWNSYEVPSVRLDGFAVALRIQPGARGYVVVYGQNGDDRRNIERDPSATATAIAKNERNYLVRNAGIDPTRVVALNGGYSDQRTVVLWVVPPDGSPPRVRHLRPT